MASRPLLGWVVLRTVLKWSRKLARHSEVRVVVEVSGMSVVFTGRFDRQILCLEVRDVNIFIHMWEY
jgi:hypothetical protein